MTPGVRVIKSSGFFYCLHEYQHDSTASSYGLEAAEKMQVAPEQVFKTLVVKSDKDEYFVAVLPVVLQLSMKLIAKVVGAKKVEMAEKQSVERMTGYVLGGVCPFGQKKKLLTILDRSALEHHTIYVSAGRRGMEIELKPEDFMNLIQTRSANIVQS